MESDAFIASLYGGIFQNFFALLLLLFASRGAGCWLLPRRGGEFLRFALGMAALAWLYPWWWRVAPNLLWTALLLIPAARGVWKCPLLTYRRHWRLLLLLAAVGIVSSASALLPPFTWDEQVYQTVLWTRFTESARRIDNPYAAYPLAPQLFMQWVRGIGGLALPRLMVWALSLILAGKLFVEARRRSGSAPFGGVLAACVMLSPLALTVNQSFYAEGFVALFALAGFLALEPGTGDEKLDAVLAGVFAGACVTVKLTGGGAALMIGVLALKRRRHLKWFIPAAAVTALPFFIRPWLVFGNPVYPFFAGWFGGEKTVLVERVFRALGDFGGGRIRGVIGWLLVCFDSGFSDGVVCGFGVMVMILMLLCLICIRRDMKRWRYLAALATGYVFWALTSRQTRFLYPLLFTSALMLAESVPPLKARKSGGLALLLALAVVATAGSYPRLRHYWTAWRMLPQAQQDPARFLALATKDPAYFNTLKLLGAVVPKQARVLLLFERRSLYVPRYFEHATPLFQEARLTPPPRSADELWRGIRDFDYLLFGSTLEHVDRLPWYGGIETQLGQLLIELVKDGRLRPIPGPSGVEFQPLLEVVHGR